MNQNDQTLALHAGHNASETGGTRAVPIYQTTSYVFEKMVQKNEKLILIQIILKLYSLLWWSLNKYITNKCICFFISMLNFTCDKFAF